MPIPDPTTLPQCLVYSYLTQLVNTPPSYGAAKLLVTCPRNVPYDDHFVLAGTVEAFCDYDGNVQLNVVESETKDFRYFFQIQYTDTNGLEQLTTLGWAVVPDAEMADLSTFEFYSREYSLPA